MKCLETFNLNSHFPTQLVTNLKKYTNEIDPYYNGLCWQNFSYDKLIHDYLKTKTKEKQSRIINYPRYKLSVQL